MDRSKLKLWTRRGVVLGLLGASVSIGCQPLNLAAFLFARDEKVPAPYPLTFDKEGPKKDKEEVVVLLFPHTLGSCRDYPTVERDLAEKLAKVLPELAKENKDKKKIRVINPTQLDKFKMTNPDFHKTMPTGEIGAKLGADFVLDIELTQVQLYQPNMPVNEKIYEGRADVSVNIYEVDKDGGALKDHYPLTFSFPAHGMPNVSFTTSVSEFKQQYIEALATKIALQHVDHKKTNSFGSGEGPSAR